MGTEPQVFYKTKGKTVLVHGILHGGKICRVFWRIHDEGSSGTRREIGLGVFEKKVKPRRSSSSWQALSQ